MPPALKLILPDNCTLTMLLDQQHLPNGTMDTMPEKGGDLNSFLYILIVIAVYVISLGFFFIKSLRSKPDQQKQISAYFDDSVTREVIKKQFMVNDFKGRLQEDNSELLYSPAALRRSFSDGPPRRHSNTARYPSRYSDGLTVSPDMKLQITSECGREGNELKRQSVELCVNGTLCEKAEYAYVSEDEVVSGRDQGKRAAGDRRGEDEVASGRDQGKRAAGDRRGEDEVASGRDQGKRAAGDRSGEDEVASGRDQGKRAAGDRSGENEVVSGRDQGKRADGDRREESKGEDNLAFMSSTPALHMTSNRDINFT